jgi:hypothetical protein
MTRNMQAGGYSMRRISTTLEIILSATLLILVLFMLYEGSSNKSANNPAILIGGAVFFTVGAMTLTSAIRSIIWHRRIVRQSLNHDLGSAAHGDNRG